MLDETTHLQYCEDLETLKGQELAEANKLSGINRLSPLHAAPFFKITKCFPQDVMHVILEGILPHEFTLLLAYLLEKRYFTLTELNMKLKAFSITIMKLRTNQRLYYT